MGPRLRVQAEHEIRGSKATIGCSGAKIRGSRAKIGGSEGEHEAVFKLINYFRELRNRKLTDFEIFLIIKKIA